MARGLMVGCGTFAAIVIVLRDRDPDWIDTMLAALTALCFGIAAASRS